MHALEFLAPASILGIMFYGIYSIVKISQENRLRKMLIQKGADAESIQLIFKDQATSKDPYPNVRFGLILVAIGGAVGLGEIFQNPQITAALILGFSGLAFLAYFLLIKNQPSYTHSETSFAK